MNPKFFISLSLAALLSGCSKTETIEDEYNDASDVPSPSDALDDIPLDELEDQDDERSDEGGSDETGGGTGGSDEEEPEPTLTYDFDADNSLIYVQVFKDEDAWLSGMAHNHVIRADEYSGKVEYNLDDLSACDVSFTLQVDDLQVDESAMRDYVGYSEPLADDDRTQIRANMMEESQLNASAYQTISFQSTSCTGDGGAVADLAVAGTLRVRGADASINTQVTLTVYEGKLYAQTSFDVRHADIGMSPYSFLGGAVRNDDPLSFVLDVVANVRD
jgi:polyisoprenoid-binding protein YceI